MKIVATTTALVFSATLLCAQDADLAKKLANPISNLLELDQPFGGMIRISSDPLTRAIQQLAK